jgi:hypothetical protein
MFELDVPYQTKRLAAAIVLLIGMVLLPGSLCSQGAVQSGKALTLAEIRDGFARCEQRIVNLSVNSEAKVDNHFRSASGGPVPNGLIQDDAYDLRQNCIRPGSSMFPGESGRSTRHLSRRFEPTRVR